MEQADARFANLIQIYNAADGSGDPMLAKVIRQQHKALKKHLEDCGDNIYDARSDKGPEI